MSMWQSLPGSDHIPGLPLLSKLRSFLGRSVSDLSHSLTEIDLLLSSTERGREEIRGRDRGTLCFRESGAGFFSGDSNAEGMNSSKRVPGLRYALEGITNKASISCENPKGAGAMVVQQPIAPNHYVWSLALELEHERRRASELSASESLEFQIRTEREEIQALAQLIDSKESRLLHLQGQHQRKLALKCREGPYCACMTSAEALLKWSLTGMMAPGNEAEEADDRFLPPGSVPCPPRLPDPASVIPLAKLLCTARPVEGHFTAPAQHDGSGDSSHTRRKQLTEAPCQPKAQVTASQKDFKAGEKQAEAKAAAVRPGTGLAERPLRAVARPGLVPFGERLASYQAAWAESRDADYGEDGVEWQESSDVEEEEDIAGIDGSIWEEVYASFVDGSGRNYCEGFGECHSEPEDGKVSSACSESGREVEKPICQEAIAAVAADFARPSEQKEEQPRADVTAFKQASSTSALVFQDIKGRKGDLFSTEKYDGSSDTWNGFKAREAVPEKLVFGEQGKGDNSGDWLSNLISNMEQLHGMGGGFGFNASSPRKENLGESPFGFKASSPKKENGGESPSPARPRAGRPPKRPPRPARRGQRA